MPPPSPQRTDARDRALDGLRGLAALAVVGLHVAFYTQRPSPPWSLVDGVVQGLRLGVVLFFVLSGALLFAPWVAAARGERARPRIAPYALRRAARVLPAYYASLVGAALLLAGTTSGRMPSHGQLLLLGTLTQNWSPAAADKLNPPAWTLGVEASFYVLLPVLGLVAARGCRSTRALLGLCAALICASVAFREVVAVAAPGAHLGRTLPATLYAFACGMAVAVVRHRPGPLARWALLAGGSAAVAADAFAHVPLLAPGLAVWSDLPAAVGFAAIVLAVRGGPGRVLAAAPLRWIGERSYGLYLWHFPVMLALVTRHRLPHRPLSALALVLALSLAAAAVSWTAIEQPMLARVTGTVARRSRRSPGRPRPGAPVAHPQQS